MKYKTELDTLNRIYPYTAEWVKSALDVAIDLMTEKTPRIPIEYRGWEWCCPNCHTQLEHDGVTEYCPHCGTEIDWR